MCPGGVPPPVQLPCTVVASFGFAFWVLGFLLCVLCWRRWRLQQRELEVQHPKFTLTSVSEFYSGQNRHTDRQHIQTWTDPNPRLTGSQLWPTTRDTDRGASNDTLSYLYVTSAFDYITGLRILVVLMLCWFNTSCYSHFLTYVSSVMLRPVSLVDGGGLWTFLCDPMHTLRSSGYTLPGIYIDDLRTSPRRKRQVAFFFLNLHHPTYKSIGFGRCAHPRKKKLF